MIIRLAVLLAFVSVPSFAKPRPPEPRPPEKQKPLPSGTILRPPPNKKTTFVLHGRPGFAQTSTYTLSAYLKRSDDTLIKYSLSAAVKECVLEKPCEVPPGSYVVRFSGTDAFLEFRLDQVNEYSLQTFVVPRIDGKYYFRIFRDLTDLNEQDNFLKLTILNPSYGQYIEHVPMNSWVANYLKPFADSGDTRQISETLRKNLFNEQGAACNLSGDGSGTLTGGCYLSFVQDDPADGNFVSVMPGVYGVEWTMPDKTVYYQLGQRPQ